MLALCLITLTACAQNKQKETKTMKKTLVAYFSATGHTAQAAHELSEAAGAELYEIKPEVKYTDADLDWHNSQSRSSVEMKNRNARPAIVKDLDNIQDYDLIFMGFPIWWYTAPTIINTFLESYPLEGKTVVLFATSGGSTPDKALEEMKAKYPRINFKAAKLLNRTNRTEMREWADSMRQH